MSLTVEELNKRSVEIFKHLVDAYMETGEPVGSRTLSKRLTTQLSPATIRNIMADLEDAGLLYAPHTSAGRLPTDEGLKFFVHGLLQVGDIEEEERAQIENYCDSVGHNTDKILEHATNVLSGLSQCAGIVLAPKANNNVLRHIEFVHLAPSRALVVLISQDGAVENRIIEIPKSITPSTLQQASNYLAYHLNGRTLSQTKLMIEEELKKDQSRLDNLATSVVEKGLGVWSGEDIYGSLIVKGQSKLLQNITEVTDLDRIRDLFRMLETKEAIQELVGSAIKAEGIQIFIGSENTLFKLSGCSMVVAPYHNMQEQIIGAIGVIGPSRMHYGRIIPLVDYTAKMVDRLMRGKDDTEE